MLYLIRGLPGSGKTTFAKTRFNGLFHIENDMAQTNSKCIYDFKPEMRDTSIQWCHDIVELTLSKHIHVVISNVFVSVSSINSYRDIADRNGSDFRVYRMVGNFGNCHSVPTAIYNSMRSHFEDYPGELIVDLSKQNPLDIVL